MKIPFAGELCPYCLRQKQSDQTRTVATALGVLVGGFIGNVICGGKGMLLGAFFLGLLAAFVNMSGRNDTEKKRRACRRPTGESLHHVQGRRRKA